MSQVTYYTAEGLQKLQEELRRFKTKERADVARQLEEARSKGDLSENAEYDAAKHEQSLLEAKIAQLETMMANARVLKEEDVDTSQISLLNKVTIKNKKTGQTLIYTLVAEKEADLKSGKISVQSPIGKGLLGKKVGDMAQVKVPAGELQFEVLEISK